MVGITGDPRLLILDEFDALRGQCRVSVRSRALRSGQLGPSEWVTVPLTVDKKNM